MPLTEKDHKYLDNKHRGGVNSQKGNTYEDFYAVMRIAEGLNEYRKDNKINAVYSSQIEKTFIDDFLIKSIDGRQKFFQMKNVKTFSWNDVEYDFIRQKELNIEDKLLFSLYLVSSCNNIPDVPVDLVDCTASIKFPYYQTINAYITGCPEFSNAISALSYEKGADNLEPIATTLLGIWHSSGKKNIDSSYLWTNLQACKCLTLAKSYDSAEMSEECKAILNDIDGLEYELKEGCFFIKYKALKGNQPWSDELQTEIVNRNPKDIIELLEII